jgi:hypothetical protein
MDFNLSSERLSRWSRGLTMVLVCCGPLLFEGCLSIPSKYLRQAEKDTTLTALVTRPARDAGKIVILGGVIVDERRKGERVWLYIKNRPLDADYHPHRDASMVATESGHYWVVLTAEKLPPSYKEWARMTVVGQVLPDEAAERQPPDRSREPVLGALYLRGWGYGLDNPTWEASQDPNYLLSSPLNVKPIQP